MDAHIVVFTVIVLIIVLGVDGPVLYDLMINDDDDVPSKTACVRRSHIFQKPNQALVLSCNHILLLIPL